MIRHNIILMFLILLQAICLATIKAFEHMTFKGDWIAEDSYLLKSGGQIEFDFLGNTLQQYSIYDMDVDDMREEQKRGYSALCSVRKSRVIPNLEKNVVVFEKNHSNITLSDWKVTNNSNVIYALSDGKIFISKIQSIEVGGEDNSTSQTPQIKSIYQGQLTKLQGNDIKVAFDNASDNLFVYSSAGQLYYSPISNLNLPLSEEDRNEFEKEFQEKLSLQNSNIKTNSNSKNNGNQSQLKKNSKEQLLIVEEPKTTSSTNETKIQKESENQFMNVKNFTDAMVLKKFEIINNNTILFLTQNGEVKILQLEESPEGGLQVGKIQLDQVANVSDTSICDNKLIVLHQINGVEFYELKEGSYTKLTDFSIPIEGATLLAVQDLQTIVVATKDQKILEYLIDYKQMQYDLNSVLELEGLINFISLGVQREQIHQNIQNTTEEIPSSEQNNQLSSISDIVQSYLFVSSQGRHSNFFSPLNIPSNSTTDINLHQTILKFEQHSLQLIFSELTNDQGKTQPYYISLTDNYWLEAVFFSFSQETLVCTAAQRALLQRVDSTYKYAVKFNSTDCMERRRYFITSQDSSPLNQRSSFCTSHGTLVLEIDFSADEQKEFEIGVFSLCFLVISAILAFAQYKSNKFKKMQDLNKKMIDEDNVRDNFKKRITLPYQLVPSEQPQYEEDAPESQII